MKDKCVLYDNTYIYRLFGISFLIIILTSSLIYLYYINNKKHKDKFTNLKPPDKIIDNGVGCFAKEQGNIKISTRPCSIYFTDNEEKCDKYEKYYDMTLLELEERMEQEKYNKEFYDILQDIANEKKNSMYKLNINKCKYTYPDWKEIESIKDIDFPQNDNNIYPHKNINKVGDNNYSLINTCIKEYSEDVINGKSSAIIDINKNNIISGTCEYPINNITDFNYNKDNQQYLAVNFNNSISYEDLYQNICFNSPKYNISIPKEYIIKLSCISQDGVTNINDISIIKYDITMGDFIEESSVQILDNIIGKFFRISYNNSTKYIYYTSKLINTNSLNLKYDMCNNITNIIPRPIEFTFKNFNIEDSIISLVKTDLLIKKLDIIDDKNETNDYYDKLIEYIIDVKNNIENYNDIINSEIKDIDTELENLNKSFGDVDNEIKAIQEQVDISNAIISKAQDETTSAIETLKNKNEEAKQAKDYNEIIKYNNELKISYQNAVNAAKYEYDETLKINKNNLKADIARYSSLLKNYNNDLRIYNNNFYFKKNNMEYFKYNFKNGLYIIKKDYKRSGDFTSRYIYSEKDFDDSLNNNIPDSKYNLIRLENSAIFNDYTATYISLFGTTNRYNLFVVEINCNIKFTKTGYYNFAINSDDAGDMFLIFKNNSGKMVRRNVANFYDGHGPDMSYHKCLSTLYPIFIDTSINEGYYGLYIRVHELGGGASIAPYFSLVSEDLNYSGKFYDIRNEDIPFEYTPFILLDKNIVNNIKLISNLNDNPFYINKNISNEKNDNFYVNLPKIILNKPIAPVLPKQAPMPILRIIDKPSYRNPSSANISSDSAYLTSIPIPRKYIEDLEPSKAELTNKFDTIKSAQISKINLYLLNKSEKEKKKGGVEKKIQEKKDMLTTKKSIIEKNKDDIINILNIDNSLKKFNNFKNYNYIKSFIKKGININNYNKNIFEDNFHKRYIYIQIN